MTGALVFYVAAVGTLGYLVTTASLFVVMVRWVGGRGWLHTLVVAALGSAGSWYVFGRLLRVKLPAGHLVLYPSTSLHRVLPVTRGARVAAFFWMQSLVRDDGERRLLYELDLSIRHLTADTPDHPALLQLTGVYHNLLRRWAET